MSWNKTDRSNKILINRRVTDAEPSKYWYNEKGDFTIDVHSIEIKLDTIPGTPPGADTAVVKVYDYAHRLTLMEDTSVAGKMTWFATSNSNIVTTQTDEASRLKNWIPDKYGSGYFAQLYDSADVQIPYSDASGWYFDYPTGILAFANANTDSGSVASRAPYKIVGYRYIGRTGAGGVTSVGGINGIKTDLSLNAPITSSGNVQLDLTYSPTWTGVHTFNNTVAAIVMSGSASIHLTDVHGTNGAPLQFTAQASAPSGAGATQGGIWFDSGTEHFKVISNNTPTTRVLAYVDEVMTGSGTPGTLTKWITSSTLGDSIASESGSLLTVTGTLRTTVSKSFYMPHPIKEGWFLEHGCLEGPENGIYQRGYCEGKEDYVVELPDYWEALNQNDYTVQITPHGNYGLYVSSKDGKSFTVSRCKSWKWRKKLIRFSFTAIGGRAKAPLILEHEGNS